MENLTAFGIHQISMHDIADPTYMGIGEILASVEIDIKPEAVKLEGGSSLVPFDVATGRASGEITATVKDFKKQLSRFLYPYSSDSETENASGNPTGAITTLTNIIGTSAQSATTGIASVGIVSGLESSLPVGKYRAVVTAAATIDLYSDTDLSGKFTFQNADGKVNSASITIASGGTTDFSGIRFTGGSGTIGMTVGDIAVFEVSPVSSYTYIRKYGVAGAYQREFLLRVYHEIVDNKVRCSEFYRCKAFASAAPSAMEKEWSSLEATIQILKPNSAAITHAQAYDSTVGTEFGRSIWHNR